MAFHKRDLSTDITTNTSYATPLPTYYSQQLPRWTSKSAFEDQRPFDIKTEPFDPCFPQSAAPLPASMPRFDDIPLPPRPQPRRLPRTAVLIPCVLAALFFFLIFWVTSIALGVRLFMALQPEPRNPPVQEVRIMVNEDMLRGSSSTYTSFVTLYANAAITTATVDVLPVLHDGSAMPTPTDHLDAAPTPIIDPLEDVRKATTAAPVPRKVKTSPTGFITIARVQRRARPAHGAGETL